MEPWHRENIFSVGEVSLNPLIEFFSKYTKVGIISISIVLLKIENKGEIIISDIIFNSVCPSQSQFFIRINLVGKGLEVFYIRNHTEMVTLPISGTLQAMPQEHIWVISE